MMIPMIVSSFFMCFLLPVEALGIQMALAALVELPRLPFRLGRPPALPMWLPS
jgi:hypothetical protein